VRVHDVVADGDQPAILMELVDGPSLARLLAERGALPPGEAARIGREVALGLAALHAQGLVHRDIKPANVLLTAAGRAKVVDLGLAKDAFTSGLTEPGQVLGTLQFMAPEQWTSGPVDARTDVFALGATLYALLVGRPPFLGHDAAELADQIAAGDVVPPSSIVPAIGPELERVVLRALDPEPDWRHGSAEALAWDLERVARGERALVPGLASLDGRLWLPLQPGRAFVLGSGGPGTTFSVPGPGVAPRHAQVRRKARGFVVAHLRSEGAVTSVGERRVDAPVDLRDGDVLRLGVGSSEVSLRLEDPRERTPPPAWLREPARFGLRP
jgi:hypothetical protein